MIPLPRLSQLPFDIALMGGLGYTLSQLAQMDTKCSMLATGILAIAAIANHLLFATADRTLSNKFKISSQAIYIGTNAVVSTLTFLAAQYFELISKRTTGCLLFASVTVLMARLSIVNN